jgi:hypothetical protein
MFDHPQIESLLEQLKARSMVIVYQILRHSLLRYVSQVDEMRLLSRRMMVPAVSAQ